MRTALLATVAAAVLLLAGCAGTTLNGTVTDLEAGTPIEGATITVGTAQATSDASGAFTIDVGAWDTPVQTSAEAPGYPTWKRLRMFPAGLDSWSVRLSKTGRYR